MQEKLESLAVNQADSHAKQTEFLSTTCKFLFDSLKSEIQGSKNEICQQHKDVVGHSSTLVLRAISEATSEIIANQYKCRDHISGVTTAIYDTLQSSAGTTIAGIEQLKRTAAENSNAVDAKVDQAREAILQHERIAEDSTKQMFYQLEQLKATGELACDQICATILEAVCNAQNLTIENLSMTAQDLKAIILEQTLTLGTNLDQSRALILRRTDSANYLSAVENAGFLADKIDKTHAVVVGVVSSVQRSITESIFYEAKEIKTEVVTQLSNLSNEAYGRISGDLNVVHDTVRGSTTNTITKLEQLKKLIGEGKAEILTQLSAVSDQECERISNELNQAHDAMHRSIVSVDTSLDHMKNLIVSDGNKISTKLDHSHEVTVQTIRSVQGSILGQLSTIGQNIERSREQIVRQTDPRDLLESLENTREVLMSVSQVRSEMNTIAELIKIAMVNNLVNDMNRLAQQP